MSFANQQNNQPNNLAQSCMFSLTQEEPSQSHIFKSKLQIQGITFEELFKNEQATQDYLMINYHDFIFYLRSRPELVEKLIQYPLYSQTAQGSFDEKSKYAISSIQVFQYIKNDLSDYIVNQNQQILGYFFGFLLKQQIDITESGYFQQIFNIMYEAQGGNMWVYMQQFPQVLDSLLAHVYNSQIAESIIKLIVTPMRGEPFQQNKLMLIDKIVSYYKIVNMRNMSIPKEDLRDHDSEEEENIALILKGLIIESNLDENQMYSRSYIQQHILNSPNLLSSLFDIAKNSINNFSLQYSVSILNELACVKNYSSILLTVFTREINNLFDLFDNKAFDQATHVNQFGIKITKFGSGRLILLKMFQNLLFWNQNTPILEKIASIGVFQKFIGFTFKYRWNNMIQCTVSDIMINAVKCANNKVLESLISSESGLVNSIIENYRKKCLFVVPEAFSTKTSIKQGNVGFITKLARFLDDPDQPDLIYNYLQEQKEWEEFVNNKLSLVSELWESVLGEDQQIQNHFQIEHKWKSICDSVGKLTGFAHRMSIKGGTGLGKKEVRSSERFIVTDPSDPRENLLNIALNGCGRKNKCKNKFCADCPESRQMSEAEINLFINEKILTGKIKVYPCQAWDNEIKQESQDKLLKQQQQQRSSVSPKKTSISLEQAIKELAKSEIQTEAQNNNQLSNVKYIDINQDQQEDQTQRTYHLKQNFQQKPNQIPFQTLDPQINLEIKNVLKNNFTEDQQQQQQSSSEKLVQQKFLHKFSNIQGSPSTRRSAKKSDYSNKLDLNKSDNGISIKDKYENISQNNSMDLGRQTSEKIMGPSKIQLRQEDIVINSNNTQQLRAKQYSSPVSYKKYDVKNIYNQSKFIQGAKNNQQTDDFQQQTSQKANILQHSPISKNTQIKLGKQMDMQVRDQVFKPMIEEDKLGFIQQSKQYQQNVKVGHQQNLKNNSYLPSNTQNNVPKQQIINKNIYQIPQNIHQPQSEIQRSISDVQLVQQFSIQQKQQLNNTERNRKSQSNQEIQKILIQSPLTPRK